MMNLRIKTINNSLKSGTLKSRLFSIGFLGLCRACLNVDLPCILKLLLIMRMKLWPWGQILLMKRTEPVLKFLKDNCFQLVFWGYAGCVQTLDCPAFIKYFECNSQRIKAIWFIFDIKIVGYFTSMLALRIDCFQLVFWGYAGYIEFSM